MQTIDVPITQFIARIDTPISLALEIAIGSESDLLMSVAISRMNNKKCDLSEINYRWTANLLKSHSWFFLKHVLRKGSAALIATIFSILTVSLKERVKLLGECLLQVKQDFGKIPTEYKRGFYLAYTTLWKNGKKMMKLCSAADSIVYWAEWTTADFGIPICETGYHGYCTSYEPNLRGQRFGRMWKRICAPINYKYRSYRDSCMAIPLTSCDCSVIPFDLRELMDLAHKDFPVDDSNI